jgi:hypothetical protein
MPKSRRIYGRTVWDLKKLDAAFEALGSEGEPDDPSARMSLWVTVCPWSWSRVATATWARRRIAGTIGASTSVSARRCASIRKEIGTAEFQQRYHELARRHEAGELKPGPRDAPAHGGTLRWLGVLYVGSAEFRQLDARTQHITASTSMHLSGAAGAGRPGGLRRLSSIALRCEGRHHPRPQGRNTRGGEQPAEAAAQHVQVGGAARTRRRRDYSPQVAWSKARSCKSRWLPAPDLNLSLSR